jgi:hypothetical protein
MSVLKNKPDRSTLSSGVNPTRLSPELGGEFVALGTFS